jgi:dTDP-glucose 4,6-dehydratase
MKFVLVALVAILMAVPLFAGWQWEGRAEARRAMSEARSEAQREMRQARTEVRQDMYRAQMEARREMRQARTEVRQEMYRASQEMRRAAMEAKGKDAWKPVEKRKRNVTTALRAYAYFATYDLPVVVTRCSNNYGPRQYPEKLVPLFITNAIDDEPLPVYGSGLNRRDWLHVDDHCAALITLLQHPGIDGETFNIGAQHELDVLTITDTILRLLGKPSTLIRHVEDRPGHDRRYAVDSSKLTRLTGWRPEIAFDAGIRTTVEWFRANEAWWRPIKQGEFRTYYERMYGQRKALKEAGA